MTTEKLHEILDDENRELTIEELCQVLYELKTDCFQKYSEEFEANKIPTSQFYLGEQNAFQICLDLMEHVSNGVDKFADKAIKNICEQVTAPTPSESYIVERCIDIIRNTTKEITEE